MTPKEMQELDAWLATNVMGWKRASRHWVIEDKLQYAFDSWHPTTDITQAFELVDKIRMKKGSRGYHYWYFSLEDTAVGWIAKFVNRTPLGEAYFNEAVKDLPLAICLAAKKAWEPK